MPLSLWHSKAWRLQRPNTTTYSKHVAYLWGWPHMCISIWHRSATSRSPDRVTNCRRIAILLVATLTTLGAFRKLPAVSGDYFAWLTSSLPLAAFDSFCLRLCFLLSVLAGSVRLTVRLTDCHRRTRSLCHKRQLWHMSQRITASTAKIICVMWDVG